MIPDSCNTMEVEVEIPRRVKYLVAFRVRLQNSVLDSVVDHLHVVTRSRRTHPCIPVFRRETPEDRLTRRVGFLRGADHQTITVLEPPDPSARAGVNELETQ